MQLDSTDAAANPSDYALGQGSNCVWAGEQDRPLATGTQVTVERSVAFGYRDLDQWLDVAQGRAPGYIYSRNTNPTVSALEAKVAALEGAADSTAFASGMAAISNTLLALLSPGDRVVSTNDTYGGTSKIFLEVLPHFGIDVVLCDTADHEAIEREIALGCRLVYLESPTNPTLKVLDLARLARAAHHVGALVVVDNTFATPINQNPLRLGADLVIHSATKFLGGHADALGGVLCGSRELVRTVFHHREITGAALDPSAAYLLLRGMKTLHLRVARQNASAMAIARWLETHAAIASVFYPGLESNAGHEIARSQMRGFGGVLSFELAAGSEAISLFLPKLRLAHLAANLGAVETIAGPPATTSHVECSADERAALGIPEGLIRYSVGIEEPEDLIADLARALSA
jgi:cystathionine gamma-synthase